MRTRGAFTQQICSEHLLHARDPSRCWGYNSEKIHKFPSLVWQGEQTLIEETARGLGHFREW